MSLRSDCRLLAQSNCLVLEGIQMDIEKIKTVHSWLCNTINNPFHMLIIHPQDILNINNKLFEIIYDIRQEFPFFSQELTAIKDKLFTNNKINPTVCGQGIEILRVFKTWEIRKKPTYGVLSIQELSPFPNNCLKMVTMQMQQLMPL